MQRLSKLLDTYGLPRRVPVVIRLGALMFVPIVVVVALWLATAHAARRRGARRARARRLFAGVWRIMSGRELSRPPDRNPVPPPSTS